MEVNIAFKHVKHWRVPRSETGAEGSELRSEGLEGTQVDISFLRMIMDMELDLGHLTKDERDIILQVLDRDAQLREREKKRIG